MGVISILLGVISILVFIGAGAVAGNALINFKAIFAVSLTSLKDISNTNIMIACIAVMGFIGILIGVNLIVTGMTYNQTLKLKKKLRHL